MSVNWNSVSSVQQQQFLQAANLEQLPELGSLTNNQWDLLAGIVGEQAAAPLRNGAAPAGTVSQPALQPPAKDVGDWASVLAKVAMLSASIGELQAKVSSDAIDGRRDEIKEANAKQMEKLNETIGKLAKAAKSSLAGKIFGWIGAVLGVVVAAVATFFSGGAAVPALAVAVVALTVMVLQETGVMDKIASFVAQHPWMATIIFGPVAGGILFGLIEGGVIDEDQFKVGFEVLVAVGMLVAGVAAGFSAGAGIARSFNRFVRAATAIVQCVGGGAATIAESVYNNEAGKKKAEMQEFDAWLIKLNAMLQEEMDRLEKLLNDLHSGLVDAGAMLSDMTKANNVVVSKMGI